MNLMKMVALATIASALLWGWQPPNLGSHFGISLRFKPTQPSTKKKSLCFRKS